MENKIDELIGIRYLSREQIKLILDTAFSMKEIGRREVKKVPALRGKTVGNLFFEPSTRTRTSFELAAKRLSADVVNFSPSTSSLVKGETILDTVKNILAMNVDILVVRAKPEGICSFIASHVDVPVVNAGDGTHEHPTQALLDAMTIIEHKGKLDGLTVLIVGDILHSRVARSNIYLLKNFNTEIVVCGPPTLIPREIESLGVKVVYDLKKAVRDADVIMMLRIQLERMTAGHFPDLVEYNKFWGLTSEIVNSYCKKDVIIMHPGPINRGVEIMPEVADGERSVILNQVENGIAVRMAVLYLISTARKQRE